MSSITKTVEPIFLHFPLITSFTKKTDLCSIFMKSEKKQQQKQKTTTTHNFGK